MKVADNITRAGRQTDAGNAWEEKITNAMGTIELPKHTVFRVRASGATTVTVDGILAMTMSANEIALFNSGDGDPDSGKPTVSVVIAGAPAWVQAARETSRVSLTVNPLDRLG